MLEAMLNHFRSYGMYDLEFIIVNSKLSHSQEKLPELEKLVSLPVYQETDEEEVWSVMEGGKDDMYIYDRCGRLTYYVPFPLSILNEYTIVSNAVLATYYQSPCGVQCDKNNSLDVEEFAKKLERDFGNSTEIYEATGNYSVTESFDINNETEDFINSSVLPAIELENEFDILNSSNTSNVTSDISNVTSNISNVTSSISNLTDYNYFVNNQSHHNNETSTINNENKTSAFLNSIYKLFFNYRTNEAFEIPKIMSSSNKDSSNNSNNTLGSRTDLDIHSEHTHHGGENDTKSEERNDKKKSNRCVEADYEVCKGWSKKRLLNAQKCCSEIHADTEDFDHQSCHNFGKKRCKKIQSILKCCIKTVYLDTAGTTQIPQETTTEKIIREEAVCCKMVESGKVCRVIETGTCAEDEFVENSRKVSS